MSHFYNAQLQHVRIFTFHFIIVFISIFTLCGTFITRQNCTTDLPGYPSIYLSIHLSIHLSKQVCLCPASLPQYNKHLFVHINQSSPSYSDPLLECVDIRQIYDKFPEKKGGLKELFAKGPQNAFYLIKFWVSAPAWPRWFWTFSFFPFCPLFARLTKIPLLIFPCAILFWC